MQHTDKRLENNDMILDLVHQGTFNLKKWKTTNRVEEDNEILTGYMTLTGLVAYDFITTLLGLDIADTVRRFFWSKDEQNNFPAMGPIPIDIEAKKHIVEIRGSGGINCRDEDAVIRGFKLRPAFGAMWDAQFELLIHPTQNAIVGKLAASEMHELDINIVGLRQADAVANQADNGQLEE